MVRQQQRHEEVPNTSAQSATKEKELDSVIEFCETEINSSDTTRVYRNLLPKKYKNLLPKIATN